MKVGFARVFTVPFPTNDKNQLIITNKIRGLNGTEIKTDLLNRLLIFYSLTTEESTVTRC
jgi:hypothetical protein